MLEHNLKYSAARKRFYPKFVGVAPKSEQVRQNPGLKGLFNLEKLSDPKGAKEHLAAAYVQGSLLKSATPDLEDKELELHKELSDAKWANVSFSSEALKMLGLNLGFQDDAFDHGLACRSTLVRLFFCFFTFLLSFFLVQHLTYNSYFTGRS